MDIHRNKKIILNDDLLRKIVYSIDKAIGEDQQRHLNENHRETNNALRLLRGDDINTNLRNHVVKDDIDLIPFQRHGWSGRIIIDHKNYITYSVLTEGTLAVVPKKKHRENPHYLQSVLYVENGECIGQNRQMNLQDFGITIFDTEVLEQDFENISQGIISCDEDYKHYIISYIAEHREIKKITLKFLDRDFNIVDEVSLMHFVKPDFARLTDIGPVESTDEEIRKSNKGLLTVKKTGLKPKLREVEKKA